MCDKYYIGRSDYNNERITVRLGFLLVALCVRAVMAFSNVVCAVADLGHAKFYTSLIVCLRCLLVAKHENIRQMVEKIVHLLIV